MLRLACLWLALGNGQDVTLYKKSAVSKCHRHCVLRVSFVRTEYIEELYRLSIQVISLQQSYSK